MITEKVRGEGKLMLLLDIEEAMQLIDYIVYAQSEMGKEYASFHQYRIQFGGYMLGKIKESHPHLIKEYDRETEPTDPKAEKITKKYPVKEAEQ